MLSGHGKAEKEVRFRKEAKNINKNLALGHT